MVDFNLDDLHRDWTEGADPERAVAESGVFFARVLDGHEDPVARREYFDLALDAQFDGAGNLWVATNALRVAKTTLRAAEQDVWRSDEFIRLRFAPIQWEAQALHRVGDYAQAAQVAYMGIALLEQMTDAPTGLLQALGSRESNVIAEQAVGLVGVLAASIQRANYARETHERLVAMVRMLFGAYALAGHTPVKYKRTLAIAAQPFYLLASEAHPADRALIEAAYALDVASRSTAARDQATVPLRDYAYARYHGDIKAALRHAEAAILSLEAFRLPRHIRVVSERALLAA